MLKFGGWPRLTWGRGPRRRLGLGVLLGSVPGAATGRRTGFPPPVVPCSSPACQRFGTPRRWGVGGHSPRPLALSVRAWRGCGASQCVTPRQACPWPDGLGRNLRSKTRWFAGFCNSHQVSHFATFFIDARAEISVAESRRGDCRVSPARRGSPPVAPRSVPWRGSRRGRM